MKPIDVSTMSLGSDAEIFLKESTGRPFPACGIIGGTKEKPLILDKDGCAVQEDNVMLEFNTPISYDSQSWVININKAYGLAVEKIPPTLGPMIRATARFDPHLLESQQACTFGCEPDYNAWTMEQNPRPVPEDPTMRSAAAHVHIGWKDPEDIDQRTRVIRMADITAGLPSVFESEDTERRKLYGRAGAFRPKKYGCEHRVLDNYWLGSGNRLLERIYFRYYMALELANSSFDVTEKQASEIQQAINEYNHDLARRLMVSLSLEFKKVSPNIKAISGLAW